MDHSADIDPEFTAYPLRALADAALQRAAELGAEHADFRAERIRGQQLGLSDAKLETMRDGDEIGLAVRVVRGGTWGFAAAVDLTIEAAVRARETDRAHYAYAHQRYAGGVGNRIDEVRANQQVQSDEADVQQQYAQLERDREALGVLVGVGGPLDAEEPNLQAPSDPAQAMKDAEHRTDVAAADVRLKAAEHAIHDNWTDYSPYLVGTFMPFYSTPATVTYPTTGWEAQLLLTVPFYDAGLRYGQQKQRDVAREGRRPSSTRRCGRRAPTCARPSRR